MEENNRYKLYIRSANYPQEVLHEKDEEALRIIISKERIQAVDKKGVSLASKILVDDLEFVEDQVIVWCTDEYTMTWVKKLIQESSDLKGLVASEESMSNVRCTIKIRKRATPYSEQEFLTQLTLSNPGWKIWHFAIRDKKDMADNKFMLVTITIDNGALEWLKGRKGRVRFDLQKSEVHWPGFMKEKHEAKKQKLTHVCIKNKLVNEKFNKKVHNIFVLGKRTIINDATNRKFSLNNIVNSSKYEVNGNKIMNLKKINKSKIFYFFLFRACVNDKNRYDILYVFLCSVDI